MDKLLERNGYLKSIEQNMTKKELKSTIVYLRIYFDILEYEHINEIPKVNIIDLISNMGGTLGLFLGMSFLSFFEIFDLIYHLIARLL